MNEKEAERMAHEFCVAVAVSIIEQQFATLAEHIAYLTPEHAQRIIEAIHRYSTARGQLIPLLAMPESSVAQ